MIEILYMAWNRLNFTGLTWPLLIQNTDWSLVKKLTVYDDGSEDGTLEYLRERIGDCPVEHELRESDMRSPPAVMNHFLATHREPLFAKIDNDICCPPRWLNDLAAVMEANEKTMLLGSEVGQTYTRRDGEAHSVRRCSHIGGVGLMRTLAFINNPPIPSRGRFGFTEWQLRYQIPRGWIQPDLMMPQIDRIPAEPWRTYTKEYVDRGWSRDWGHYPNAEASWWSWIGLHK